jgi:predicted dehydrogenase
MIISWYVLISNNFKKDATIMKKSFRIGSIGCGGRSIIYLHWLREKGFDYQLTAIADPNLKNRDYVNTKFADGKAACFVDGQELIESCDVDGVIIATPNHLHRGPAVMAMRKGCKILLEKPVAPTVDDLSVIWEAYQTTSEPVIIGFVLRYAPLYQKLYQLVKDGMVGQVMVINAEEQMSDRLSTLFARGNWRNNPILSGGLMLEKCSHDIDLLNWFAGGTAVRLSSFAKKTFLVPKEGAATHCKNCKFSSTCRFDRNRIFDSFKSENADELFDLWATNETDDACIYGNSSGYPDHQTVNIEYDNGVLCNFTLAQAQPTNTRTMHILGTKGRIYADFFRDQITLFKHTGPNNQELETLKISHDGSGHGGSDSGITADFLNLLKGQNRPGRPGLKEGIESSLMCLACDMAAESREVYQLAKLRSKVFSHDSVLREMRISSNENNGN